MRESTRNGLIGLFVMASLGVGATLMVMFGETPSWLGGDEWQLTITGVRGLRGVADGTPVYLNGVEIGRVTTLEFANPARPDRGVNIIVGIKKKYTIPRGAMAKVYGPTLGVGAGHVDILVEPQGDRPIANVPQDGGSIAGDMASMLGGVIRPEAIRSAEQMIDNIRQLAGAAVPVAEALADLMEQRRVKDVDGTADFTGNVSTVVERLDRLLANVNTVLGDETVQGDVRGAVSDLKRTAEELREFVKMITDQAHRVADNLNEGIDRTDDSVNTALARLTDVAESLDDSAKNIASITHGVAEGKGSAGLFARDPRLYEAAVLSLQRLADLLGSLRRITGKIERDGYITLARPTPVGPIGKRFPVKNASDTAALTTP
ncbi:MAG: MlaD family protein [Phycisphaerae bacterium]